MKVFVLASGSSGNASLYESRETSVLVDAGLGLRALVRRLRAAGAVRPPRAIVVTHAHNDHVGACEQIARRLSIPVYMTESTARQRPIGGGVEVRLFGSRAPFSVGDIVIAPLPLPHDAAQVALTIADGTGSAALVTDLGEVPAALPAHIAGADVLLIESNHDVGMVERGPYPGFLKRRILSSRGHLSNAQTHALLARSSASSATHSVVLMHLSKTNNREDLALEAARDALAGRRVRLTVAPADGVMVLDTAAGSPQEALPARPRPPAAVQAQAARGAKGKAAGQGQGRRSTEAPVDVRQLDLPFLS